MSRIPPLFMDVPHSTAFHPPSNVFDDKVHNSKAFLYIQDHHHLNSVENTALQLILWPFLKCLLVLFSFRLDPFCITGWSPAAVFMRSGELASYVLGRFYSEHTSNSLFSHVWCGMNDLHIILWTNRYIGKPRWNYML